MKIETTIKAGLHGATVVTDIVTIIDGCVASHTKQVLDTTELAVRERLIQLGWTPPSHSLDGQHDDNPAERQKPG